MNKNIKQKDYIRITPEKITSLQKDEVFVFGSNEAGKHGGGAARIAHQLFGAEYGIGFGLASTNSFAIPTKDWNIETLPLHIINFYVNRFITYANIHKNKTFYVTKIGCGLAGYTVKDIAPMFNTCTDAPNIILPKEFWLEFEGFSEALLEQTLDKTMKLPVLPIEDNKTLWDIKEGVCPPEKGSCPMEFMHLPAGEKHYCPSCNKIVYSSKLKF